MYVIKVRKNKNSSNAIASLERVYGTYREVVSQSPVRVEDFGLVRQSDVDAFRLTVEKFYKIEVET